MSSPEMETLTRKDEDRTETKLDVALFRLHDIFCRALCNLLGTFDCAHVHRGVYGSLFCFLSR